MVYALGIGPLIQLVLRMVPDGLLKRSGWARVLEAKAPGAPLECREEPVAS